MKKIIIFMGIILMLAGCGKNSKEDVMNKFSKKVSESKGYNINASLKIIRDDNKYTYDIESSYQAKDKYKVKLINKTNNHEQIILKNNSGVYVVTPKLNKSFKFQSDWPYNNSQIYLLQPIVTDLEADDELKFETKNNQYIFTSKVNYINDKTLVKQKIYIDKEYNLKKVEVYNKQNEIAMLLKVTSIKMNASFDKDYFNVNISKEDSSEKTNEKNVSINDESIYPMFVPEDTYLSSQEVVKTNDGNRTIMTFAGSSPFTLIQEKVSSKSMDYMLGDPYLIIDTVGAINDDSVRWVSNDKEYYVTSDTMKIDDLLTVAESINVVAVGK